MNRWTTLVTTVSLLFAPGAFGQATAVLSRTSSQDAKAEPSPQAAPSKSFTLPIPAASGPGPAKPFDMPRIFVRGNYFLTDEFANWMRERGMSLQVSEFYVQSSPNTGTNSDLAKVRAGNALSGDALEQYKRSFPGWNLQDFPLKAAEHDTGWRRQSNRFHHAQLGLRDHSSWEVLGSRPATFEGIILNDYEGWMVEFMHAARPGEMSAGDRRMLAAMMQAHQALRARYPKAKRALYDFPYSFPLELRGSIGMLRSMVNDPSNPLLYGDDSVAAPHGKRNASAWIAAADRLRDLDRATVGTPALIRFASEHVDVLTPTCYPRAVPNGAATWGGLDYAGGETPQDLAKVGSLGGHVRTGAAGADLRQWNASLHKGRAMTRDGVTSIFFQDPKLPELGWHTSNFWQTYRAIEISKAVAAKVRSRSGRSLPIMPVIGWHNLLPTDVENPLQPLTPAEFEEAIVLPAKLAGADAVYVWDAHMFPIQVLVMHHDKDSIPGQSVAAMRKSLRQLIVRSGVPLDPRIPASDSVTEDPRWKDASVVKAFIQNTEAAKKVYYQVILRHFGDARFVAGKTSEAKRRAESASQRLVISPRP